jgi:ferredoxin-NADP reductase
MAEKAKAYDATLVKVVSLTATVKHFVLEYAADAPIDFAAGQFLMVHLDRDGKPHKKPYSIASSPKLVKEKKQVELSIKLVEGGFVSNWFFKLKEGAKIQTSIPYGFFTVREPWADNIVFVGTGTGVAPLRGMIHRLYEQNCDKQIWLIFGNRYDTDILYLEEWRALEKAHKNFHFIPTISRSKDWRGETAYVQEIVKKQFAGKTDGLDFYGCGLVPMCQQLKATLNEMQIPKDKVHFEQFT